MRLNELIIPSVRGSAMADGKSNGSEPQGTLGSALSLCGAIWSSIHTLHAHLSSRWG